MNDFRPAAQSDEDFDALLQTFRTSAIDAARQQQAAARITLDDRRRQALARPVLLRWQAPAALTAVLVVGGAGWGGWWYAHPAHSHPSATNSTANTSPSTGHATSEAALSDDALLTEVQNDLSDPVPHALQPLAVSYTTTSQAGNGQKAMQ